MILVLRFLANTTGAASHSDHGRDLVEVLANVAKGQAPGYAIRGPEKLKSVAAEYGVETQGKDILVIAGELADYGTRITELALLKRAPAKRREIWKKLGITPRGIDRETSEMMHRTHMGVDNGWQSLLLQGLEKCPLRWMGRLHDSHGGLRYPLWNAFPKTDQCQRRGS
jgi:carbon-monoxide dehydrogenase catalytic subunit